MIEDRRLSQALEEEVDKSDLSADIWEKVREKIDSRPEGRMFLFGLARSRLAAAAAIFALVLVSMSAGAGIMSLTTADHLQTESMELMYVQDNERALHFDAVLQENEVSIEGAAPLPDEAKVTLLAYREITVEEDNQLRRDDVLIAFENALVKDGQFSSALLLDDSYWYDRGVANGDRFDSTRIIDISNDVVIAAVYIPEAGEFESVQEEALFSEHSRNIGDSSVATAPDDAVEKGPVVLLPRQVVLRFPFSVE